MNVPAYAADIEHALRATRPVVEAAFAAPASSRRKADGSVVTDLDLALEEVLANTLLELDSGWGIVGEESGEIRAGTPTWHLDPVDGTSNFARRSPLFGCQVALLDGTTPLFSAVYEPLRDDYTWAAAGCGAWREGERLRLLDPEPARAMVYVDVSKTGPFVERPAILPAMRRAFFKLRLLGSIALHLRDVAAGVADAYVSSRGFVTAYHDLAPGLLLCREAGAVDSDGAAGDPLDTRETLVVGTRRVHDAICAILRDGA
ncbi:MAG: inositol monophosphatase family protein [Planctomycetota bacterium]|nr:inositol monophosphatase family protein [Planctomycetota bacterium]